MKNNKRIYCILMSLVLIMCIGGIVFAQDLNAVFSDIKLLLNGNRVDEEVLIVEGTSYLPVKAISEALGLEVKWNKEERAIYLNENYGENEELKERVQRLEAENRQLKERLGELDAEDSESSEASVVYPGEGIKHTNYYEGSSLNKFTYSYNKNEIKDNMGNAYSSYTTMYIHNNSNDKGWNSLEFLLNEEYKSFKAKLGLTDRYKDFEGEIILEVYKDDFKIYTEKLKKGDRPIDIDLNVVGGEKIKFNVSTKGKTYEAEIGLFNARFIKND